MNFKPKVGAFTYPTGLGKQREPYPIEYYQRLRKESNFGCVYCGKPIVTIHHIEGYEGMHPLQELVMLCNEHHKMADEGKIKKEKLYQLKKIPYNSSLVKHKFTIAPSKNTIIHIGSNTFFNTPIPLEISNDPIIQVRKDRSQLLFSARFYDENDDMMLEVIDNAWNAATDAYDIRYSENKPDTDAWLAIRMSEKEPFLDIKLRNEQIYIFGKFYKKGKLYEVTHNGVFLLGKNMIRMSGNVFNNLGKGIVIDESNVRMGVG